MDSGDNVKVAMQNDEAIARQQAADDAITLPTHEDNPAHQTVSHHDDPASPFALTAKTEQPIEVTDPVTGKIVKFNILANGRAKLRNPEQASGGDYKEAAVRTILETATSLLNNPSFLPDANNVKALLLLSNKMTGPVTEAMNTKGYDVFFKMFTVTPSRDQ